jgi:hypothetical protein
MGMFDTVLFKCPKCGKQLEEQSKAGECLLEDFSENRVPVVIALSIVGNDVYCGDCKETFEVAYQAYEPLKTVPIHLIKKS